VRRDLEVCRAPRDRRASKAQKVTPEILASAVPRGSGASAGIVAKPAPWVRKARVAGRDDEDSPARAARAAIEGRVGNARARAQGAPSPKAAASA
jgi:hypothetical protein